MVLSKLLVGLPLAEARLFANAAIRSLKVAGSGDPKVLGAAEDQLALAVVAKLVGVSTESANLKDGLRVLRRQTAEPEKEAWLLGKRRDWDEFVQNLVLDTRARIVKKTRIEALNEAAEMQNELEHEDHDESKGHKEHANGSFNANFDQESLAVGHQDGWNAIDTRENPFQKNTESASNPFGEYSNREKRVTNEEYTESIRLNSDQLASRIPNDVIGHPQKQDNFSKKHKFPKKQLFDSDSDDDKETRIREKTSKAIHHQNAVSDASEKIQEIGSPIASVEFLELGHAPSFNF